MLTGADVLEMQRSGNASRSGRFAGQLCARNRRPTRESENSLAGRFAARIANALSRRPGHGVPRGRSFCVPEDFKPLVVPVFAHRVVVSGCYSSTLKKSVQAEEVMQEIVDQLPVPI